MNNKEDSLNALYSDDNLFNLYLAKITDAYQNDKNKSYHIIKKYVDILNIDNKKEVKENDIDNVRFKLDPKFNILYIVIICFIIILLGLFSLESFPGYFFGSVFFFAGLFIGLFVPIFGLIFLFSHGLTGFCIMMGSIGERFTGPLYSDASGSGYFMLLGLAAILAICGFIFTILHNIGILKKHEYGVLIPFLFFLGCFLICALFPYLFKILC